MIENSLTLSALNDKIAAATQTAFPQALWVTAEILELNVNRSGHCYLDLVEKATNSDDIIARCRATIWASRFQMIRPYFETTTRNKLAAGIKILIKVQVSFHTVYGLSLNISDIDPTYTIGDLARKKQEAINKLIASGVIDMNKELEFPQVPQRIAVITSETAAGYGDFIDSLLNNNYDFSFKLTLFPAIVQGNMAEKSIIEAFEKVFSRESLFDVVVLIRGGGSQADLECFNSYNLALNIAQFPLPVLTGIGHERDESLADIVAYRNLKTPTAVAEYLIDSLLVFKDYMEELHARFEQLVSMILQREYQFIEAKATALGYVVKDTIGESKRQLEYLGTSMSTAVLNRIRDEHKSIQATSQRLRFQWRSVLSTNTRYLDSLSEKRHKAPGKFIKEQKTSIEIREKTLQLLSPERVLARGYSITYAGSKAVKSVNDVDPGDEIRIQVSDGEIKATTKSIKKNTNKR